MKLKDEMGEMEGKLGTDSRPDCGDEPTNLSGSHS